MSMTIAFSQVPNQNWNSVLNCTKPFPTQGNAFSGRRLICPPPHVLEQHYRDNGRRFSGHEIFSMLLQVLVAVVATIVVAPTWCRQKYRVAPYLMNMELIFGSLGMFTLPSVIALIFALQEYYTTMILTLNEDDSTEVSNKIQLELFNGSVLGVPAKTWRSIAAACVVKDQSIRWTGAVTQINPNLENIYTGMFSTKDLSFKSEVYDYALLKALGFCPHLSEMDIAAIMLMVSTVLLFILPITNLCCKHNTMTVSPADLKEKDKKGDEEQETKEDEEDPEAAASLTTFNTETEPPDDSTAVTESATTLATTTEAPSSLSVYPMSEMSLATQPTIQSIAASSAAASSAAKKLKPVKHKKMGKSKVREKFRNVWKQKPKPDYSHLDLSGMDEKELYDNPHPKKSGQ